MVYQGHRTFRTEALLAHLTSYKSEEIFYLFMKQKQVADLNMLFFFFKICKTKHSIEGPSHQRWQVGRAHLQFSSSSCEEWSKPSSCCQPLVAGCFSPCSSSQAPAVASARTVGGPRCPGFWYQWTWSGMRPLPPMDPAPLPWSENMFLWDSSYFWS